VVGTGRDAGRAVREGDPLPPSTDLAWGYERSKWVAERLVVEAGVRGLPVSIHRPGRVAGHSRTGVWNADDLAARWLAGVVELGAAPELDVALDVTPVDWVAQAIAHLCGLEPEGRVYHLTHARPTPLKAVFEHLRARGHALEGLDYAAWLARARAAVQARPEHALAHLLALAGDSDDPADLLPDLRLPPLGRHNVERDVVAAGLPCPEIDADVLGRWIDHLERARAPIAAVLGPRGAT